MDIFEIMDNLKSEHFWTMDSVGITDNFVIMDNFEIMDTIDLNLWTILKNGQFWNSGQFWNYGMDIIEILYNFGIENHFEVKIIDN